jgi:hypothetical protein
MDCCGDGFRYVIQHPSNNKIISTLSLLNYIVRCRQLLVTLNGKSTVLLAHALSLTTGTACSNTCTAENPSVLLAHALSWTTGTACSNTCTAENPSGRSLLLVRQRFEKQSSKPGAVVSTSYSLDSLNIQVNWWHLSKTGWSFDAGQ